MSRPNFCKRFLLLSHKNFLWKLRNWKATAFEFCTPIALSLLLVFIALILRPESHPTTQTAAKALPSAGLVPFLQTMACDLTDAWSNGPDGLPHFSGARDRELYELIYKVTESSNSDSEFAASLSQLTNLLNLTSRPSTNSSIRREVTILCKNESLFAQLLLSHSVCANISNFDISSLSNQQLSLISFLSAFSQLNSTHNLHRLPQLQQELATYENLTKSLYLFINEPFVSLCGPNVTKSQVKYFVRFLGLILAPALKDQKEHTKFNSSEALLDNGVRILFSPNTSLAWSIVHRMNHTFAMVGEARNFLINLRRRNSQLQTLLHNYSVADPNMTLVRNLRKLAEIERTFPTNFSVPNLPSSSELDSAADLLDTRPSYTHSLLTYSRLLDLYSQALLVNPIFRVSWDFFRGFPSEESLVELATNPRKKGEEGIKFLLAGVVFQNLSNSSHLHPHTSYKIRMNSTTSMVSFLLRDVTWRPDPENSDFHLNFLKFGYIFIQDLVERAIIDTYINSTVRSPGGYVQPFPYPCYQSNQNLLLGQISIPLLLTLGGIVPVALFARAVVLERERRLRDMLSVLGVGVLEHWGSWMGVYYLLLAPSSFISLCVLKLGTVLPHSSIFILFPVLLSYNLSLLALSLLLSLPFRRATLAASVVGLLYFLLYFLVPVIQLLEFQVPDAAVILSQLLTPTAMGLFMFHTVQYELKGTGLQWHNLAKSPLDQGFSTPVISWACILVDAVLYLLMALYLQAVIPGAYGARKPWYFLATPSFWLGAERWRDLKRRFRRGKDFELVRLYNEEVPLEEIEYARTRDWSPLAREREPDSLELGVSVENLSKVYTWGMLGMYKRVALHSINLCLYEGQITALLGHNGAGKTSLMMILSGIARQSSGNASVYGENVDRMRAHTGLCPQHNILFPHLTIREHLRLFGALRGLSRRQVDKEGNELLSLLQLLEHSHKRIQQLSGGMCRKLSVSLAFLGAPRFVVLDEPTAGVDPISRRQIWNFLLSQREQRCVLLSTHHLDEAEVVGDRIAMIDHGHLLCDGGLPFLKATFGLRYSLTVEKGEGYRGQDGKKKLEGIIGDNLSPSSPVLETEEEVRFPLSCDLSLLPPILSQIQNSMQSLRISSYGLLAPTLEQLFLMLTEFHSKDSNSDIEHCDSDTEQPNEPLPKFNTNSVQLILLHSYALIVKRLHNTRRDIRGHLLQLLPFLCSILLAMSLTRIYTNTGIPPTVRYRPGLYLPLTSPQYFFLGSDPQPSNSKAYLSTIPCPGGLGVPPDYTPPLCAYPNTSMQSDFIQCSLCPGTPQWSMPPHDNISPVNGSCHCDGEELLCPTVPQPPQHITPGDGSTLQDLGDLNVTEYLLRSFYTHILNRYQGATFGHERSDFAEFNTSHESLDKFSVQNYSKAWFSFTGYRAMPSSLNVMNNAILRKELRDRTGYSRNFTRYGIIGSIEIWPLTPFQRVYAELTTGKPMLVCFMMLFGYSFLAAYSVVFVLEEKVTGVQHLQILSGLSHTLYWAVSFLCDLLSYSLAVLLSLPLIAAFQYLPFVSKEHLSPFLLASLLFGLATISLCHLFSRFFRSPSLAYVAFACVSFLLGLSGLILLFSLDLIHDSSLDFLSLLLRHLLLFLPHFSFPYILYNLIKLHYFRLAQTETTFSLPTPDPFEWDPIGQALLILAVEFIAIYGIHLCISLYADFHTFSGVGKHEEFDACSVDSDVEEERERALAASNTDTLSLQKVSKRYDTISRHNCHFSRCSTPAVTDVTLGVKSGCFGLLGVNGAGKTTLFNSITGITRLTAGRVLVQGLDVSRRRRDVSYCPQFDTLFPRLTGREQLFLYGRVRGISGHCLARQVRSVLGRVQLAEYADLPAGRYSGGNRRKLQTAIALVSQPSLLLLDEPTAGVDPYAKQSLWRLLRELTQGGVACLVTTHSMGECEALCSRIGILHRGRLRCVGSPQHLRAKFGCGGVLKVYLTPSHSSDAVSAEIGERLGGVCLHETHPSLLSFYLDREASLSGALDLLLEMKRGERVADFSLGQSTLDDVFLRIVSLADRADETDSVVEGLRVN